MIHRDPQVDSRMGRAFRPTPADPRDRLRRRATAAAVLLLAFLPAMAGCGSPAGDPRTRVVSVGDGDTIRVDRGEERITVRLACIDAPEMAQAPHGKRARDALRSRLKAGQRVRLKVHSTDRYGRTVAEVFSGADADANLNLLLVEEGRAFAYRRYLRTCDARTYLETEDRASRRRLGVWAEEGGITRPWDFRRAR